MRSKRLSTLRRFLFEEEPALKLGCCDMAVIRSKVDEAKAFRLHGKDFSDIRGNLINNSDGCLEMVFNWTCCRQTLFFRCL